MRRTTSCTSASISHVVILRRVVKRSNELSRRYRTQIRASGAFAFGEPPAVAEINQRAAVLNGKFASFKAVKIPATTLAACPDKRRTSVQVLIAYWYEVPLTTPTPTYAPVTRPLRVAPGEVLSSASPSDSKGN